MQKNEFKQTIARFGKRKSIPTEEANYLGIRSMGPSLLQILSKQSSEATFERAKKAGNLIFYAWLVGNRYRIFSFERAGCLD